LVACAYFLEVLGHECGHVVAGLACGKKLWRFHVGPLDWFKRSGTWRFEFNTARAFSGSVVLLPATMDNYLSRKAIGTAGGPLASLTMAAIALIAAFHAKDSPWEGAWFLLAMWGTTSAVSFLGNLIPSRTKLLFSDGAQIFQILSGGPWSRVHWARGMVASSLVSKTRPRDWDIALLQDALNTVRQGPEAFLFHLLAASYFADKGMIPEVEENMTAAEQRFNPKMIPKPADFYSSFVFHNAFFKRDVSAAESWWGKLQALPKIDFDPDYFKAQAALLWLRGEIGDARQAWTRGNELAHKLPACGSYDFTRSMYLELAKQYETSNSSPGLAS
jgi:hypothetical protein